MPELPEVETVRRGLERLIVGKTISAEKHDTPKGFPNTPADVNQFLLHAKITNVRRRAKVLLIDLSTEYTLVIHLKMTGQLVFIPAKDFASQRQASGRRGASEKRTEPYENTVKGVSEGATMHTAASNSSVTSSASEQAVAMPTERFGAGHPNESLIGKLPDKSTRVTITFSDNSHLYFNDQRKFGWMRLLPTSILNDAITGSVLEVSARRQRVAQQAVQNGTACEKRSGNAAIAQATESVIDFMKKVGPEPLEDAFTPQIFITRIRKRNNTTIKAAILDQTVLAGIGNIYADEGLWGAKIHPAMRVRDVSDAQLKKLYTELRFVLNLSIEKGGSTDRNYVNAEGKRGSYIDFARVFRREGKDCPRHSGVIIEKIRVAGRGTHICPICQKLK